MAGCSSLAFVCVGLARAWASTAIPSMTHGQCGDQVDNVTTNCTNPNMLTLANGDPLSEEVISWVLATLPMGAMVKIFFSSDALALLEI